MIDLLAARPGELLSETLLHFLWQGIAVALSLRLCDPLLRTVQSRYSASLGALAVMLALPFATYFLLAQRELNAPLPQALPVVAAVPPLSASLPIAVPSGVTSHWQPWLVGLWLAGVMILAARLVVGYLGTLWLRCDRRPLPAALAAKVAWLGRRLGVTTRCRVYLSARVGEAIAVGCFKPLVLIPLAWASELPTSALEAIIAHELAHIHRWDLWAMLLQRLAETLLFYHPAVWWLSRRLSLQRELCCDALAVSATRSPADYVLALEIISRRTSAPPLTLATAFLGGGKMNLLERVRHVLAGSPREASAWWPAGLAALAAPLLAAIAIGGWSLLPAKALADDDRETEVEAEVDDAAEETSGLMSLAVRFLAAGEEGDGEWSAESNAEGMEESDEEAGKFFELVVRVLGASEEGDEAAEVEEEQDEDEDDEDHAALRKKQRALAERHLRDAEATLSRKLEKLKEEKDVAAAKRKGVKKRPADDFELGEFRPQTEREEQLLAVIKKLQAQVNERPAADQKVKSAWESSHKKGPPEFKNPEKIYDHKILDEELKQDDAYRRAISEKKAVIAKELAAKENALKREYQRALAEKEAAVAEEQEARERAAHDYKRAIAETEAIFDKERQAKEQTIKEKKTKDLDAAQKQAYLRAFKEKEAIARKQREAAAAAEQDAYDRKLKGDKPGAGGKVKSTDDEVEALHRALKQRDVELQKLHEALEQLKRVSPEKKVSEKEVDNPQDENNPEGESAANQDTKAIDDYIRERWGAAAIRERDQDAMLERNRLWLDLFGMPAPPAH